MNAVSRVLVLGVGNRDRGDDGVGPAVIDALKATPLPAHVEARSAPADASAIHAAWDGVAHVILIDACVSGGPAGTIRRLDPANAPLPADRPGCSSHGFGLAAAVELARAMGKLPQAIEIFAVEGSRFETGTAMSEAVAAAVPDVVARVAKAATTAGA